jgi:hypothetical protein
MFVVFLSGTLVGALGQHLYSVRTVAAQPQRKPDEWRHKYVAELTSRLKLDDGQVQKLNAILDDTRDQFRVVKSKYRAEMDGIHTQQVEKVRGILTASQQAEYENIRQERERLMKEREKREHDKKGSPPGI